MRLYKDFRFHILEDLSMDSILYVYRMFSTSEELEELNIQQIYEEAQRRRYVPIDSNLRLHVGEVFLVDNTGLKLVDKIENLLTEYLTGEYDWEIVSKIQQQLKKLIAEGVITDLINEEVLNMKVDQSEFDAHVVLADREIAELRALIQQANDNATGAFLNANSLQTTVMGFSQSIYDLTQYHWETIGNIEEVETRFGLAIDDQNRQIVAINDTASLMRTEMDTYVEDLSDLGRELTGVTDATIRLSGDFSALAGRVTNTETTISTQGSRLTSTEELLESSIYDYNTKITSVDAELTSTKAGMEDAVARITATETVVDNHSTLIAQHDDRINLAVQSIEGVVETVETEIEGLRGDMASIQQTAEYIDVVLDDIVGVSDETRALVDTQIIRIDELKDDLTDVTVRTDTIESNITDMNAEITIAKNAITSAVSDYTTQIEGMNTTITGISDDLGAVETTLGVHTTEISELDSKIVQEAGRITSAVSDYTNKFTTVNTNIATEKGRIDTLNTNLSTEKGRIDTLNTNLNTEKGRINTLNTNLGTVTTDVTAAKAAIAEYGTRIEVTEGEIVDLDSRITQEAGRITSAVTEYRNNYSTLSGDIDDLGIRLTTTEEDIVDLDSKIEQTATNITSTVSAVSNRVDTVSATANTAKSTADTAKTTADQAKTAASTADGKAVAAQNTANTANTSATNANSKIDNLKIGGRNLLRNSGTPVTNTTYPTKIYDITTPMVHDDYYTVTLKGSLGAGKTNWGVYNSGGMISLISLSSHVKGVYTGTFLWKNVSGTNTANDKTLHIYPMSNTVTGVDSTIEWIKLEKGNRATDWTPAPEDVDAKISTEVISLNSKIDQTAESIESSVSNITVDIQNNVESITALQTLVTQTSESLSAEIVDREAMGDNILVQMRSAIELEVDNMGISFSELQQKLENSEITLAEVSSYFNFSANGLEIGKSDSPFKVNIDNEEISFLQNGTRVAYITGSTLYIQQSTILDSITMANHIIEKSEYRDGRTLFRRV